MTLHSKSNRRPRRDPSKKKRAQEGMTLVEIMIVVVIMALVVTGASLSLNALTKAELRSSALRLVSASRFAYGRSVAHGSTVRLALNFEENTLAIEETYGRIALARQADARRMDSAEGDDAAVDPWAAARQRLSKTFEPSLGETTFEPVRSNGSVLDRYRANAIGDGIEFERLYTPHEAEPRTTGLGSVYYFRGGQTESAVIQISDGGETVFSVVIHPLTGRARVINAAYEPENLTEESFDEDDSEVRDDG